MAVDPRHLQLLLDVARSGSFSAAAKLRNVSQPAVSLAIAQLERQIGALLLDRNRRGVRLTPAGVTVVRRAEAVEQQLKAAQEEVGLHLLGVEGPLTVGGTPGALASVVPLAIRRLTADGRKLSLRVVESGDAELNDMLFSARIDVALTTVGVDPVPPGLVEFEIGSDDFEVVVGTDDPLPGPDADLADLADRPWVLPEVYGAYRRQVEALFFASQVRTPVNVVRCDSLTTTKELVRLAGYTAVLPRPVIAADLAGGVLRSLPLRGRRIARSVGLRVCSPAPPNPLRDAFVEAARSG